MIIPGGLHIVDWVAFALILLGGLIGFRRGLSEELARLVSVLVMLVLGWRYFQPISEKIAAITRLDSSTARPVAFVGTCLLAFLVMHLIRILLRHVMEITFNKELDRWLGLLAGLLKTAAIVAVVMFTMMLLPNTYLNRTFVAESMIGRRLAPYLPTVLDQIRELTEKETATSAGEK